MTEAVVDGILDRGEMSAEALECLAPALDVYEGIRASRRREDSGVSEKRKSEREDQEREAWPPNSSDLGILKIV
jgi:hypothetical protein